VNFASVFATLTGMSVHYSGLTSRDVLHKRDEFGFNQIVDSVGVSPFVILFRQIKGNYILYLLFFSVILSFLVGKESTAFAIILVILVITSTGFFQEYRAEQAIAALRTLIVPLTMVLRDGREQQINSTELVPGDVVFLHSGERVPADVLIIEGKDVHVDESILTGESLAVVKTAVLRDEDQDIAHLLYMGSFIVSGRCVGSVVQTGMRTKFGSIATMISNAEKSMPLTDKVNQIARYMMFVGITISILTGLLMLLREWPVSYADFSEILILTVALSVAAFPEGLPVVLTTTLALGASRMARKNAIVNRMSAITTLGETTVICTDKTGTITEGEMTVRKVMAGGQIFDVSGVGYSDEGGIRSEKIPDPSHFIPLQLMLEACVVCNDAKIERISHSLEFHSFGTPTESALLVLASKVKRFKENSLWQRLHEHPFSSDRKMMSVLASREGRFVVFVKGAPEVVLPKCSHETVDRKGDGADISQLLSPDVSLEMSNSHRLDLLEFANQYAREAYRVMCLGYKVCERADEAYSEDNFTLLGFAVMEDPPREEVADAIRECQDAHIKVKMITGDNKETATAIGRQVGLTGLLVTGDELDALDEKMFRETVRSTTIFARVRPEHKLQIVKALKFAGEIVTMTGDGVNDAPALKEAHIGVAMGKNGTDVSRSVADLTLKDDNFATIVEAIREGRTIFVNIRKFVSYMLSCNYSQLLLLFGGVLLSPLFGWQVPIVISLQILFMNLITDDMPALTLGFNPTSKEVMREPPRLRSSIMTTDLFKLTIVCGIVMGVFALIVYFVEFNSMHNSVDQSRSATLVAMVLLALVNAFHFRSFKQRVLGRSLFINPYLFYASLVSLLLTFAILYTPLSLIFETTPLSLTGWVVALGGAFGYLVILDIIKSFRPLLREDVF
jgi:Ca2+-transporting ATPase